MPVSKIDNVELVQLLAGYVKNARQKSKANRYKVAGCDGKFEGVNLKVHLLPDDSEKVARL